VVEWRHEHWQANRVVCGLAALARARISSVAVLSGPQHATARPHVIVAGDSWINCGDGRALDTPPIYPPYSANHHNAGCRCVGADHVGCALVKHILATHYLLIAM
jgi:hypothetical protein